MIPKQTLSRDLPSLQEMQKDFVFRTIQGLGGKRGVHVVDLQTETNIDYSDLMKIIKELSSENKIQTAEELQPLTFFRAT